MKKLLLIGGGHSHVEVIRRFARQPATGVQLTLVNPTTHTPYSGMLPGLIAGHYSYRQCHIDLPALAGTAGCRYVKAAINGLQLAQERFRANCPWYAQSIGANDVCGANAGASTVQFNAASAEGLYNMSIAAGTATGNGNEKQNLGPPNEKGHWHRFIPR